MGKRIGFGWFGFFSFGGISLFVLGFFPILCACSEEMTFPLCEMLLLLISDWVAYLVATQMAHPCLKKKTNSNYLSS